MYFIITEIYTRPSSWQTPLLETQNVWVWMWWKFGCRERIFHVIQLLCYQTILLQTTRMILACVYAPDLDWGFRVATNTTIKIVRANKQTVDWIGREQSKIATLIATVSIRTKHFRVDTRSIVHWRRIVFPTSHCKMLRRPKDLHAIWNHTNLLNIAGHVCRDNTRLSSQSAMRFFLRFYGGFMLPAVAPNQSPDKKQT